MKVIWKKYIMKLLMLMSSIEYLYDVYHNVIQVVT